MPYFYPGALDNVVKALNSAHMVKVDSTDKLQQLAQNILTSSKLAAAAGTKSEDSSLTSKVSQQMIKKQMEFSQ